MEERKCFLLPIDYIYVVEKLPDAAAGHLINLIFEYVTGLNPDVSRHGLPVEIAFIIVKPWLDAKTPAYLEPGKNSRIRASRLKAAKEKGTHKKIEWLVMKSFFEATCVKCHGGSGLLNVERDHIIPLHMEGSDSIRNIQPLCSKCNTSKRQDTTDYRPTLAKVLGKDLPDFYKNPY